jgi:hypothetical protein
MAANMSALAAAGMTYAACIGGAIMHYACTERDPHVVMLAARTLAAFVKQQWHAKPLQPLNAAYVSCRPSDRKPSASMLTNMCFVFAVSVFMLAK